MIIDRVFFSAKTLGFYAIDYPDDRLPSDAVEIAGELWSQLLAGQAAGKIITTDANGRPTLIDPPKPTPDQTLQSYTAAIQGRLDAFAQSRGYDSGVSCASYAVSTNATFKAEAGRFIELRDQTWAKCYAITAEVKAGSSMPTLEQIIAELPPLEWAA